MDIRSFFKAGGPKKKPKNAEADKNSSKPSSKVKPAGNQSSPLKKELEIVSKQNKKKRLVIQSDDDDDEKIVANDVIELADSDDIMDCTDDDDERRTSSETRKKAKTKKNPTLELTSASQTTSPTSSTKKRKAENNRQDVSVESFFGKAAIPSPNKKNKGIDNHRGESGNAHEDNIVDSIEPYKPESPKKTPVANHKTNRQSPRKKAVSNNQLELEPTSTPQKRASPSRERKTPGTNSSIRSNRSNSSAGKKKRDAPLEPTSKQESFDVDAAAPECLSGYTFVCTGVNPTWSRDDASEFLKTLGARVTTAVSSKTDYLVVLGETLEDGRNYQEGKKYQRAQSEKGCQIIDGKSALFGLAQQYHVKAGGDPNATTTAAALSNTFNENDDSTTKKENTPPSGASAAAVASKPKPSPGPTKVNPYARSNGGVRTNPYARANPYAKKANPYAKAKAPPHTAAGGGTATAAVKDAPSCEIASKSGSNGTNALWVDRYKPATTRDILGNQESVRKLTTWLNRWEDRFLTPAAAGKAFSSPNGPWKAALLSGPPGIGKTTTATLVATESGRDVLEFNASDVRSKKALHESLGDITGSRTIEFGKKKHPSFNAGSSKTSSTSRTKRCIIMDEVDGMGAGDRSGMSELIKMIKNSRVPIICICNDRQSQKMKSLLPYCMDLRYRRPTKSVLATRAMDIAAREGLQVERNAAEALAESCGNDVRQVLNSLQMWASQEDGSRMSYKDLKKREHSINKDAILRVSLFDAARSILEGRRGLSATSATEPVSSPEEAKKEVNSFFSRNDAFFVDYNFVGLLVQQNYLKVVQGQFSEAKRKSNEDSLAVLERMHEAAHAMSDFAVCESALRDGQNWGMLPSAASLTVKVGYHAGGPSGGFLPGFPEFTTWLGRNSSRNKKMRLMSELQHHMNYKISTSGTAETRMVYVPVLRNCFLSLLVGNNDVNATEEAIHLMDDYGLDRDDVLEKLDEFNMDSKSSSFSKMDSRKKAAFTKAYNQGPHTSQALVAEQGQGKKTKRKTSSAAAETADLDAIDDDDKQDEEAGDVDDELDVEKLKAMFKKKGRGKAKKKNTKKKK